MLHAAIGRLVSKRETDSYSSKVYISEVDANRIQNHRDRELFSYLVEATMNENSVRSISFPDTTRAASSL